MNIKELYPGLDSKTLKELFQIVAPKTKISRTILEKDLYMTGMLLKFLNSLGEEKEKVYFKGGTALSKCHKIIQRFSEDCDLFVFTGKGDASRTQESILNSKITNCLVEIYGKDLSVDNDGKPLSPRGGDYNKICIDYEKSYPEDLFKPHVEFELTSCPLRNKKGYYVSSQELDIQPIVGEILYSNGMKEIADKLSLYPQKVKPHMTKVTCFLMPQRTRCALMVPLEADRTALPTYGRDSTSAGLRRQRGIQTN